MGREARTFHFKDINSFNEYFLATYWAQGTGQHRDQADATSDSSQSRVETFITVKQVNINGHHVAVQETEGSSCKNDN